MRVGEVPRAVSTLLRRLLQGPPTAGASAKPSRTRSRLSTSSSDTMTGVPAVCPLRLQAVSGYEGRTNDIVYCYPEVRTDEPSTVVFFGGDLQDFLELMESHRENRNYMKWNLENTSLLLRDFFPESHVVVVRPSRSSCAKLANFMDYVSSEMDPNRMEFKTFSCYDNFVPCNNCGAPDHTPTHYALQHLERLLQNLSQRLRTMPVEQLRPRESSNTEESGGGDPLSDSSMSDSPPSSTPSTAPLPSSPESCSSPTADNDSSANDLKVDLWWRDNLHLDRTNLSLVGFSKGCVVLNQFIYEFHYLKTLTPDDDTMSRLVSRIKDMYWLDGGHAGGKNTWITSRSLLETLTRLSVNIHIHVTPYQVQDERRPWIRKEEKAFSDLLKRLGASVERTLHFENQVATLMTHFDVLACFKRPAT